MSEERQDTAPSSMDKAVEKIADTLVSDVIEQVAANLSELLQNVRRWDSDEHDMSEDNKDGSSAGSLVQQRVQQHLEKFFAMRQVFAEHCGNGLEDDEVTKEDVSPAMSEVIVTPDSQESTKSANKAKKPVAMPFMNKLKLVWKSHFGRKHSKKVKRASDRHLSSSPEKQSMDEEDAIESEREQEASISLFLSPKQVDEVPQPKGELLTENETDFQEEMRHDEVLRATADTEKEVSTPDLVDSCSQAFEKTSTQTSLVQTIQVLPIKDHEDFYTTKADEQTIKNPLEPENEGDDKESTEVRIPDTGSSSRLSSMSEESKTAASSASPPCTPPSIYEAANMIVSQVIEQAIRTLESEAKAKRSASTTIFKTLKTAWKKRFGKRQRNKVVPTSQDEAQAESFGLEELFAEPVKVKPAEAEDDKVMEIPSGPSEEDGRTVVSQGGNEAAADQTVIMNSSTMSLVIMRFFQGLTEEQWREVSEGVFNRDVKEKLIDMCVDVLKFSSDSVIKNVLESLAQSSTSSGTFTLKTHYDIQRSVERSFSQALCNIVGTDIPVRISPEFTEAIATEVFEAVTPVLSVAIQASVDERSLIATAPANLQVSKDKAAKKTLAGAISTMKSLLTGRGAVIKRRVMSQQGLEPNINKKPARGREDKKNESLWRRCFRQKRRIQPFSLEDPTESNGVKKSKEESRSPLASSSITEDPPLNETMTSEIQEEEETKTNGFCSIFCNIFSKKKNEKKKKEKTTPSKKLPLWMRLFCSPCTCPRCRSSP
ncbi:uncharacterized protein LOC108896553 isoform X2 [Lates calcarifer]|uniref:Uncharacterized protein LOC108896553 isoform X2 n=1 Tax=Lates calcarifer TaxID=8187 RepID=A0AAJ7QAX6_LATCA|nr:uncharacterized protein LOC108896553 isoform X2 [Lates calcarifer]